MIKSNKKEGEKMSLFDFPSTYDVQVWAPFTEH
jgi:hypothetical protein